jgi:hypothetical protein
VVAEPVATERDLWRIWESQGLPVSLTTRDGRTLRVLFPGVPNTAPGPDFRGALLAFDGRPTIRGDVEVHLQASSWEGHGHHLDWKYDNVALHVVLFDDGGPARTSVGAIIPVLALGPILTSREPDVVQHAKPGPCFGPHVPGGPVQGLGEILSHAGGDRFDERSEFWEAEFAARHIEDCMLLALLRCTGLGRNQDACSALARALDGLTLDAVLNATGTRASVAATAILLGMGGLIEEARADEHLRDIWSTYKHYWAEKPLDARQWQRFRLRPANLPENRLRLIAIIMANHGLAGLLEHLVSILEVHPPASTSMLLAVLAPPGVTGGRAWALEAWTNVLLPLLAAYGRYTSNDHLVMSATGLYATLPGGGNNSKLDRMTHIAGLAAAPHKAIEQQGLLQLWSKFCSRQNCGECPLAAG